MSDDADDKTRSRPGSGSDAPVVGKTYDLLLWYVPVLAKFPRDLKYGLGDKLIEALVEAHGALAEAAYGRNRGASLTRAASLVDRARLLSRLAKDLRALDHRRYEFAAVRLVEIGKMIGGWRRHDAGRVRTGTRNDPTAPHA